MMHFIDETPEPPSKLKEFSWLMFALIIVGIPFMYFRSQIGAYYNIVYVANFFLGFFWSKFIYPYLHKRSFWLIMLTYLILVAVFLWECFVEFYLQVSG